MLPRLAKALEHNTTRKIGKIKELIEEQGVSPDVSLKVAVEINDLYQEDQEIAEDMRGYWACQQSHAD